MNMFLWLGISVIFIIVSVFLYNKIIKKLKYNPNNEYIPNNKVGELMLFYVDWCPYSQSTKKQWYTYKKKYKGDYKISFVEIDCDKNTNLADTYKIDSYPTIILLVDGKKYIYDAQMNDATLTQFINTIMK
uniref:Thioredoxin domain-containing protein n=1 Tax=viral metagenome TaxID=1070528 RepID=A0A6C0D370_9ZZZZ